MGREIRRVPPGWEHPRRDCPHEPWRGGCSEAKSNGGKCYQPMYDKDIESAYAEWLEEFEKFKQTEHERVRREYGEELYPADEPYRAFCNWHSMPPDPAYYRPKWDESKATWFQVYQTVSEGSPVTPPFATREELIDYLCTYGDFWDQRRRSEGNYGFDCDPWPRSAAENFVNAGWAPSMMVETSAAGVVIKEPRDGI